jgi:hypothetical protein
VFDLSCPKKISDFKKIIDHLKQAHLEEIAQENADINEIIFEACKHLGAEFNVMISKGAPCITKQLTSEYT